MSQHDPQRLVAGITQVASLPEVYTKMEMAMDNPKSSSRYLSDILSEDAALTARILRLANSSFFSFPDKINTVAQAVTVIGTRQLRDIVLASSIVSVFKGLPDELVDMKSFWKHSIACGVACRVISTLRREANVETAFVSGLLHDIGRLVLYKAKSVEMGELLNDCLKTRRLLYEAERGRFGYDHATLGGLLLKEWKLSNRLVETTTCHHNPASAREYVVESATVHIGDILSNTLQEGNSGERYAPPISPGAWQRLGLDAGCVTLITDELDKQYAVAVDFVLSA